MNTTSSEHSQGVKFVALVVTFVFTLTSVTWNTSANAAPTEAAVPAVFSVDKLRE